MEAESFFDNSGKERDFGKVIPSGLSSVESKKGFHKLLVNGGVAAKVDDDVSESNRCGIRCSQTTNRSASVHARQKADRRDNYMKI